MKLIRASANLCTPVETLEGAYKMAEMAGRTCYHSLDKITDESYKDFIEMLKKNNHLSPLEHCTVYLKITSPNKTDLWLLFTRYATNHYSKAMICESEIYATTNLRVIIENGWEDDLQYVTKPCDKHRKRISAHIICDRGVLAEITRHRAFSFSVESTRFCRFSKKKFGNEVTFILPPWINDRWLTEENYETAPINVVIFLNGLKQGEQKYFELLNSGWKAQQARNILPHALKTELIMTGFIKDWEHFFSLRNAESAHPQTRELSLLLEKEMIKNGQIQ